MKNIDNHNEENKYLESLKSSLKGDQVFKVDDSYFNTLNENIQSRISYKSARTKVPFKFIWMSGAAMASVIALVVILWVPKTSQIKSTALQQPVKIDKTMKVEKPEIEISEVDTDDYKLGDEEYLLSELNVKPKTKKIDKKEINKLKTNEQSNVEVLSSIDEIEITKDDVLDYFEESLVQEEGIL
ncbi:MAG: hypothetical protein SGJ04_01960 [Bacteroidota bacterium]|nr:hypothetical protein [Bacteroidota bacterium]